jgi:putative membrane protein
MKILIWTVRFAILLVLVWFSVKNAEIVTLHAYPYSWQAPLVLIILAFFASGVLLGLLASLGSIWKLKREVNSLKREVKARENALAAAQQTNVTVGTSQSTGVGSHGV